MRQLDLVLKFFDDTQDISCKEMLQSLFVQEFSAVRESTRGIFDLPDKSVSVRFTQNNKTTNGNASNTVIAIGKIFPRDEQPILSVMVTAGKNYVRIMNSSFINKIPHSSKNATADKLRGSINYSNIIKEFEGMINESENIKALFDLHSEHDFWDNYERIYGLTSQIKGKKPKFMPTEEQKQHLMGSGQRSLKFLNSEFFQLLSDDLKRRVERNSKAIVVAGSFIKNAKVRGEIIEYLITSDDDAKLSEICSDLAKNDIPEVTNPHGFLDYERTFEDIQAGIDIKTKVMYLDSQPKGFSIDDALLYLSEENTVFLIYWVGIEKDETLKLQLLPVFERNMLKNHHIQKHWSGINQRGHIQFDGKMMGQVLSQKEYAIVHMTDDEVTDLMTSWIEPKATSN